ncbi:class I SAM-dependent methyltransferase [Candidatus Bipolaricaulota bacterium]
MPRDNRYGSLAVKTYRLIIDPLIRPLRPKVVELCRDLDVETILDIASGTGAQCRMLGEAGISATGVDLSEDMVAHAQARGGRNVRYVQGSAYELPFDDASFEACVLVLALHEHTEEERTRMFAEALRVASRYVVIADYERPQNSAFSPPWQLIRFIEHSAGAEHNAGFKHFVATGCLASLTERHGLIVDREQTSHFGTMRIVAVRTSKLQILA